MDALRDVRRLPDLRVDGSDPIVGAIEEQIAENEDPTSGPGFAGLDREFWQDLVPAALEVGWWELWLRLVAPKFVDAPFALHHRQFWKWWMQIDERRPRPFVGCWNRGGAKTTTLQLALLMLACQQTRNYCLYIGAVQDAVDDKVADVGELMVGSNLGLVYPGVDEVYRTSTGQKRDMRKSRIRNALSFTLDSIGMDQALIRGIKVGENRPGLIVLDDLEKTHDTPYVRNKKIETITNDILGAVGDDTIIVYIQNMIHDESIMSQVVSGKAQFMADRIVSGPIPQIVDLEWIENPTWDETILDPDDRRGRKFWIIGGTPTWQGLGLEESEKQLNTLSPPGFLREKQHDTDVAEGDKFPRQFWRYLDVAPPNLRLCRSWDLAASESPGADYTVGTLMGMPKDGSKKVYILDVVRGQWGADKVEATARQIAEQDLEDYGRCPVLIEGQPGAAGKQWSERWKKEILFGIETVIIPPQGSKDFRADGLSAVQRNAQVYLVNAEWNSAWVGEYALFPDHGRHDDQVDTGSQGFNWLSGKLRRSKATAATAAGRQQAA